MFAIGLEEVLNHFFFISDDALAHTAGNKMRCVVVALLGLLVPLVVANQWAPHLRAGNPFFEGWYTRISTTNASFGVIFGDFAPPCAGCAPLTSASHFASLLVQLPGAQQLQTFDAYPSASGVTNLDGTPIAQDPDDTSVPQFQWSGLGVGRAAAGEGGAAVQTFDFRFANGVVFKATLSAPVPWGPNGEGPEGWVAKVRL